MKFTINEEYDSLYPEYLPVKIRVRTSSGKVEKEVLVPKGHFRNPFTWDDLENKGKNIMGKENARKIVEAGKRFESLSIRDFFEITNVEDNSKSAIPS